MLHRLDWPLCWRRSGCPVRLDVLTCQMDPNGACRYQNLLDMLDIYFAYSLLCPEYLEWKGTSRGSSLGGQCLPPLMIEQKYPIHLNNLYIPSRARCRTNPVGRSGFWNINLPRLRRQPFVDLLLRLLPAHDMDITWIQMVSLKLP